MTPPQSRKRPRKATRAYLERAAMHYLERHGGTIAAVRRILMRRVEKSVQEHGTDPAEGAQQVEEVLQRLQRSQLLDDGAYARSRASTLRRRGHSRRAVREKLRTKGVDGALIEAALAHADEQAEGDAELAAAARYAQRRRLGPYRTRGDRSAYRDKDLAALGRAGFPFGLARQVIDAEDADHLAPFRR
jgi:regulatory protein